MIHFPSIGEAYTRIGVPGSVFSLVSAQRRAPTRDRQFEDWELELMCVVVGEPSGFAGNDLHPGKLYYIGGALPAIRSRYACLTL